jgi:hypothetical protein
MGRAGTATPLTMTPADVLTYQSELVRTGKTLPLGRMQKIFIGPVAGYEEPNDPYIRKFGRMIDLRDRMLPVAKSPNDESMILVTAPMVDRNGRVNLPDVPDPSWYPDPWTADESTHVVERDPLKDKARMIPQRLEDRTSEKLAGTNFLVFQPVLSFTFQPEIAGEMAGRIWICQWMPTYDGQHCAMLVDQRTGQTHFFGGRFSISTATGE